MEKKTIWDSIKEEKNMLLVNTDYIAFVEVKSRKPNSMVSGYDAINKRKQTLIVKTASNFCYKHPNKLQPRFDIAEVIISGGRVLSIDYIENAFDTTGMNFIF